MIERILDKKTSAGHFLHRNGIKGSFRQCFVRNLSTINEAVELLNTSGTIANHAPYAAVLKLLGSQRALQDGKRLHHLIVSVALDLDLFVVVCLIRMYSACAAFGDAFSLFSRLHERSPVSWNFLLHACAQYGEEKKVVLLLNQMLQEAVLPTKATFVHLFDACSNLTDLHVGFRFHSLIINGPLEVDVVLGTALLRMYGKFGNGSGAWNCFHKLLERDVIAWTALICALSNQNHAKECFNFLEQMLQESIMPNEITFINLCGAYTDKKNILNGKLLHVRVSSLQQKGNVMLENALITMYGKLGSLKHAESIFTAMTDRTLVSWTAIISVYAQDGRWKESLQYFVHMYQLGILPDNVLFATLLASCRSKSLLIVCKHMHAIFLIQNPEMDVVMGTVLVNTYGKCQDPKSAKKVFDSIGERNVYTWNAFIVACTQNMEGLLAGFVYVQMQEEGILPNKVTFVCIFDACASDHFSFRQATQLHACILQKEVEVQNALIDMYGKHGDLEMARLIFDAVINKDSISWTALITAYVQHGLMKEAVCMFISMCEGGIMPDGATFVSILCAFDSELCLDRGQEIHTFILEMNFEGDIIVSTALVSMYGRCERVADALSVFNRINKPNEVTCNAMMAIYEQAGQAMEVLELFGSMIRVSLSPDHVTFVTVVCACTSQCATMESKIMHAFIVESGCILDVVLISAIINMYGKVVSLEDAQRVFEKMPEPNVVSWNTMLALYAQHGLVLSVFEVFNQMQSEGMQPNLTTFINILGACSHCGCLYEASHYFELMDRGCLLSPTVDVFVCLIDLYGRAGSVDRASALLKDMPVLPSSVAIMALLGACKFRDDVEHAIGAAKYFSEVEEDNFASALALSNLYVAANRMYDATVVMNLFGCGLTDTFLFTDEG